MLARPSPDGATPGLRPSHDWDTLGVECRLLRTLIVVTLGVECRLLRTLIVVTRALATYRAQLLRLGHQAGLQRGRDGTVPSGTASLAISHAFLSSISPHTRHVTCANAWPC